MRQPGACEGMQELCSARLDGRLSPAEARRLETHLAGCEDCRHVASRMQAVWDLLCEVPTSVPVPDFLEKVKARLGGGSGCTSVELELVAYLDGELVGEARRGVEAHLLTCSPCRTELLRLRQVWEALEEVPGLSPLKTFVPSVRARIEGARAPVLTLYWRFAAAAAVLLAATLVIWFARTGPERKETPRAETSTPARRTPRQALPEEPARVIPEEDTAPEPEREEPETDGEPEPGVEIDILERRPGGSEADPEPEPSEPPVPSETVVEAPVPEPESEARGTKPRDEGLVALTDIEVIEDLDLYASFDLLYDIDGLTAELELELYREIFGS